MTISSGVSVEGQSVGLWGSRLRQSPISPDRVLLFGVGEDAVVGLNMRACANRLGGLAQ